MGSQLMMRSGIFEPHGRLFHPRADPFRTSYQTSQWIPRFMASSVAGTRPNFLTQSLSMNEPVVSADWLHANLGEPDLKIGLTPWMPGSINLHTCQKKMHPSSELNSEIEINFVFAVVDASWYMPDEQRNPFKEYQVAHIPGALFFDVDGIVDRTTNLPHMLPSEEAFAAAASALGIENKDGIVVYDGKGIFSAARVWWMFQVFGHEKVWVLDGGLPRWRASGYDVESSASSDAILKVNAASEAIEKVYKGQTVGPITFQAKFQPHLVWTFEQVKQNIEDKTHQHIDARSKARFDGTAPEPRKGIKSGHVPGSKCIPFPQMLDASQTLLPADELKKWFDQEGISLESPVVLSCGTGVTACVLALVFILLFPSITDTSWHAMVKVSIDLESYTLQSMMDPGPNGQPETATSVDTCS
ncbi:hypothetical protein SADUNF_Sadunf05G0068700 [Salix dunnii]|uniref:Rhodanese domain-containing protein n=1 Tax=Salix dunnii TaxID=1413687 RepID=A0A835N1Y9_9ROSI|nr:hypothetical protein SADUNF_Sadunf05G0068700 [Salix dunnii]